MKPTLVINVVGLTPKLMDTHGPDVMPNLCAFAQAGGSAPFETVTPAVTTVVQSTMATGRLPGEHGIVANGWYFREQSEVWLWRQSNKLVQGEKIWESARRIDPSFTCAKMFWWYNMYSSADWSVTPRPMYPADGRKIPDVYASPGSLRDELNAKLGQFPLFNFWGPTASIVSSQWIADSARFVADKHSPTLNLVYMPHLDYNLQRLGPNDPAIAADLREIDATCGELIDHAAKTDTRVMVLSEYGITDVDRPIHINRALREAGLISIREELGRELMDAGASDAFALADHQIAHIYLNNPDRLEEVRQIVAALPGVESVLDDEGKRAIGLDHPRSGDLVAVSDRHSWFTYYYWLDDSRAPDFARTVDIHRKPGYDPAELFVDRELRFPKLRVAKRLAQKKLGMRYLMDVIGLDASLVKGSHGRVTEDPAEGPLVMTNAPELLPEGSIHATDIKQLVLDHVFKP